MSDGKPGPALASFINATSGGLGALVTTTALYPVDLAKTRVQTGRSKESVLKTLLAIVNDEGAGALFKGLGPKALQSVAQNFIYFYAYAYYTEMHSSLGYRRSYLASTALGCLAGVTNLAFTLPLDTLVVQVQSQQRSDGEAEMSTLELARGLARQGPGALWRGMGISSVLTLNPAITNAIFDGLKARYLALLSKQRGRKLHSLTPAQSFVCGSIAKVIATLATYPLVRAKVMQQARAARGGAAAGTIPQLLREIVRDEGAAGLYRGCDAQIGSAVTKSGFLLATKEQMARYAIALVLGARRRAAAAKPIAAAA